MRFLILSPRPVAGGPIVLHVLCKELVQMGYDAKILYCPNGGRLQGESAVKFWISWLKYNIKDLSARAIYWISKMLTHNRYVVFERYFHNPVGQYRRQFFPFVDKDTIVVYPDIFWGNILNATKVVRWLLYFNRFPGDTQAYGKKDLFFCYRKIFNDEQLNPEERTVCLQNFDFDVYKRTNFEDRTGCCYIIRKGNKRTDLPKTLDGPIIDSLSERKKVEAFNKYKFCYFYDTQTFYTVVAAVCGCIPIVVLEPGKSKADYLSEGEQPAGVAYGENAEEIQYAIKTREKCIEQLQNFSQWNKMATEFFVKTCEEYFGKIS